MTTTTPPDAVLATSDTDVPSPLQPTPERKRHWLVPVVVGAVAFGAGVGVGSRLTWRFSAWWKPN